jgi:hypothetical protein
MSTGDTIATKKKQRSHSKDSKMGAGSSSIGQSRMSKKGKVSLKKTKGSGDRPGEGAEGIVTQKMLDKSIFLRGTNRTSYTFFRDYFFLVDLLIFSEKYCGYDPVLLLASCIYITLKKNINYHWLFADNTKNSNTEAKAAQVIDLNSTGQLTPSRKTSGFEQ